MTAIGLGFLGGCADRSDTLTASTDRAEPVISHAQAVPAREHKQGGWARWADEELWRQAALGDTSFIIGLKRPGSPRGVWLNEVLVSSGERAEWLHALAAMPGVRVLDQNEALPMLLIRISDPAPLTRIRHLPWTDYLEPNFVGVSPEATSRVENTTRDEAAGPRALFSSDTDSSLGCSEPPEYDDFAGTTNDGDKYSWSFDYNNVVNAWRRSQGDNIRVALIDTGVDVSQPQLTSRFNAYPYASRSIWYLHVKASSRYPDWTDDCGHGTRMAGVIAAPRDGQSMVGVAYKADLISIRVDDDPYVKNTWDVNNAIRLAVAPEQAAHIVVMAFKTRESSAESLADIIRYYYYRTDSIGRRNGPLFIGAAGTSGTDPLYNGNVLFPADLAEVIAVSGVQANGTRWPTSHYGPEVELAGYVPQATVGIPGIFGNSPTITRLVGSSGAAASVAGIAALVWARYPWMTNAQLRDHLRRSASHYPDRNDQRGYGTLHAYKAVGGFWGLSMTGPNSVYPNTTHTYEAVPLGDGPFTYQWSNGATSRSTTYTVGPYGALVKVTVTDMVEGTSRTISQRVDIGTGVYETPCDPNLDPMCPM